MIEGTSRRTNELPTSAQNTVAHHELHISTLSSHEQSSRNFEAGAKQDQKNKPATRQFPRHPRSPRRAEEEFVPYHR
jgi:hypothetical protein